MSSWLNARGVLFGREVAPLATPAGDRPGNAADHLLDRALTLGRAELAAEVLLGDDVGRVLRPAARELDVLLLEGDAVAVPDARVAKLPLDGVEGMHAGGREAALHGQRLAVRGVLGDDRLHGWVHRAFLLCLRRRLDAH